MGENFREVPVSKGLGKWKSEEGRKQAGQNARNPGRRAGVLTKKGSFRQKSKRVSSKKNRCGKQAVKSRLAAKPPCKSRRGGVGGKKEKESEERSRGKTKGISGTARGINLEGLLKGASEEENYVKRKEAREY